MNYGLKSRPPLTVARYHIVMRKLIIALLVVTTFIVSLVLLRIPVLEGSNFGFLRTLYVLFYSPDDLYEPLVRFPFDAADETKNHTFTLTHLYSGAYGAGLFVEKGFDYHEEHTWTTRLRMHCTSGESSIDKQNLGVNPRPFLGLRGNGFSLVSYQVPKDLPQGIKITCQLKVLKGGQELKNRFGRTEFYVQKQSDL